jgi:leucyl-tRNA synthetase
MDLADSRKREEHWQAQWRAAKAFEAEPRPGQPKFFMTVPYPYISGSLHIGHARVVTEADVYTRYQRMMGKATLFPIAFHISGTPVLGISLAIKQGDQKKIDLYKSYVRQYTKDEQEIARIVASFEDPHKIVAFFIPLMKEEFSTLGLSVDWRRSYTSGDFDHQALVEWQFRKYKEQGYLVQGKYPILYSLSLKNAVGEDDISEGDTDAVETQQFTLIKFRFGKNGKDYLIAATLRPETMYGQTNMWVNPHTTYVRAAVAAKDVPDAIEHWIISEECVEKLQHQDMTVTILERIEGKSLIGKSCFAPFVEREIIILPSDHCDPDIGTGIVTSVPSDAPFDHIALQELQASPDLCAKHGLDHNEIRKIAYIPIIATKGYGELPGKEICAKMRITTLSQSVELQEATQEIYKAGHHTGVMRANCGPFTGMRVTEAREAMRDKLLADKRAAVFYETSRKAKSRDGGKVIVAVLDNQWFLDFNAKGWKERADIALNDSQIIPEKYRARFQDTFAWLDKRPCARRRGLGTMLPFDKEWVIESLSDSTIYMALYPIAHRLRAHAITKEQMNDAFFDYVMRGEGDAHRASVSTRIPAQLLTQMHDEWQYWYPFDQRHTFTAHLSNHLSFMYFAHTACLPRERWPKRISFHGMIISEGEKMSKSKGNVITLVDIKERYGADSFRAFMCNSTSVESTFDWKSDQVGQMQRHLDSLFEVLSAIQREKRPLAVTDCAFLSRTERSIARATEAIDRMDLREYSTVVLYEMLTNYKQAVKQATQDERAAINAAVGNRWVALLAPLVPHIAEELWHMDPSCKGFVSLAPWPAVDESHIDERAEADLDDIQELLSNVRKNIHLKQLTPKEIVLYPAEGWKCGFIAGFRHAWQSIKQPQALADHIVTSHNLDAPQADALQLAIALVKNQKLLPLVDRSAQEDAALVTRMAEALAADIGCAVRIGSPDEPQQRAKSGLPGRPAVVIL